MDEEKGLPLFLKVVIIIILTILVVIVGIFYYRKINFQSFFNNLEKVERAENNVIVSQEDLIRDYKERILTALEEFDGDCQTLQDRIVDIAVPKGFQELHLKLVLALNPILYENDSELTKERLREISEDNEWLLVALNKVISEII